MKKIRNIIILMCIVISVSMPVFAMGGGEESSDPYAEKTLNVVGGFFLRQLMTGEGLENQNINIEQELLDEYNTTLDWYYVNTTPESQQALYRIGPLTSTEEDLIFVNDKFVDGRLPMFMTSLTPYLEKDPIEGWPDDYSQTVQQIFSVGEDIYTIPMRVGVYTLWYNQRIFEERGIDGPPETPEELLEIARKCTYTTEDGEKVFGFGMRTTRQELTPMFASGARMFGGDLISQDGEIMFDDEPAIKFLEMIQTMVAEGIMPSNWGQGDNDTMIMNGQYAMFIEPTSQGPKYNNPLTSREAGNLIVTYMPLADELKTEERDFGPGAAFIWSIGILNGSSQKEDSWNVIKKLFEHDSVMSMALNGNGPARLSVLQELGETDRGMAIEANLLKYTSVPLPANNNYARIADAIGMHMENVCLSGADPATEMAICAEEVKVLL